MPASLYQTVFVFDHTGNRRVPVTLEPNDQVYWKRNGVAGCYKALVVGFTPKRVRLLLQSHDGRPCSDGIIILASGGFLSAWRNGRRLPD